MAQPHKLLVVDLPPALLADVESVSQRGRRFLKAGLLSFSVIAFAEWGTNAFDHRDEYLPPSGHIFSVTPTGTGVSMNPAAGASTSEQKPDLYGEPLLMSTVIADAGGTCSAGTTTLPAGTSCTVNVMPLDPSNSTQAVTTTGAVAAAVRQRASARQAAELPEADGFIFDVMAGSMFPGKVFRAADVTEQSGNTETGSEIMVTVDISRLLPDEARKSVNKCFAVLHGNLDASDGRAMMKANDLTCSTRSGRVFRARLPISVTDSSGRPGISGPISQKTGEVLADALIQGSQGKVIQDGRSEGQSGRSGACGDRWQPVQDRNVAPNTAPGGELGRQADFYMARSRALFPVIEVPAGTPLNFVVPQTRKVELMVNPTGVGTGCATDVLTAPLVATPAVVEPIKANWWLRGVMASSGLTGSFLMAIGGFLLHRGLRLQALARAFQKPQSVRRRKRLSEPAELVAGAPDGEDCAEDAARSTLDPAEVVKKPKRSKRKKSQISFEVRW